MERTPLVRAGLLGVFPCAVFACALLTSAPAAEPAHPSLLFNGTDIVRLQWTGDPHDLRLEVRPSEERTDHIHLTLEAVEFETE